MEYLHYNIAGHSFIIETPDSFVTKTLIPTFDNFLKTDGEEERDVLFRFIGNCNIVVPKLDPVEDIITEGINFKLYIEGGVTTVYMREKDVEYHFSITSDRDYVFTDLTLISENESNFLFYFLRTVFGILSAFHKTLKVHASVIEKDGKALVFLGKSGTGKSTQSRLWLQYVPHSTLLNDDEPLIRIMSDGTIRVYGAPWSGSTPCYRNIFADLSAFVFLQQSSENLLYKLDGLTSFSVLLKSTSIMRCDNKNRLMIISVIYEILEKASVYRLNNRPEKEAVALSKTLLI